MAVSPLDKTKVTVGMRIQNHNGLPATIRWIGRLEKSDKPPNNDNGTYIGVEYDEPTASLDRCDGKWNNVQKFSCPPGTGEIKKPKEYYPEMNPQCIAELRAKYGEKISAMPDSQLVKFCIARKYEMPKVCLMLDKHLAWMASFKPNWNEYHPDGMELDYPVGFGEGTDREGNLLYFERPGNAGKCHPKDFVGKYGLPAIARWHAGGMEYGKKKLAETGFKSQRVTCVIDLSNLGDCGRPMVQFAKTLAAIDQDNYPEHLSKLFIINAPGFFTTVWKLVRFFLDDRTKTKIFILDAKEQKQVLDRYIEEKYLPTFAGGSNDSWFNLGGRVGSSDPNMVTKDAATVIPETSEEDLKKAEEAAKNEK
jgi:hypothetical protein